MEPANNLNKKPSTPEWVHDMPGGDEAHAQENQEVEATARAICRLPKIIVARKVDGAYQESPEHRKSVRTELVTAVNLRAERLVQEREQAELDKAKGKEVLLVEAAIGAQKSGVGEVQKGIEKAADKSSREDQDPKGMTNEDDNQWEDIALEEQETVSKQSVTQHSVSDEPNMQDWEVIGKNDVATNEDYVFRQVQSAQVKGMCILQ